MSANKVFGSVASLTIGTLLGVSLVAAPSVTVAGDHGVTHEAAKHAAQAEGMAGQSGAKAAYHAGTVQAHAEKAEHAAGVVQHHAEKMVEDAKAAAYGEDSCEGGGNCEGDTE